MVTLLAIRQQGSEIQAKDNEKKDQIPDQTNETKRTWNPSLVDPPRLAEMCVCVCVCVCVQLLQQCPTPCNLMDCSPPGSSVHGILQARILEWVAISFSRGSSQPRDQTQVSCVSYSASIFFTTEPPGKPQQRGTESQFRKVLVPQMGKLKLTQILYSPLSFPISPHSTYSHPYHCFCLCTFLLKPSNCSKFIYFQACWDFCGAHALHCSEQKLLFSCDVWAFPYSGFSRCGARVLGCGLSSSGLGAQLPCRKGDVGFWTRDRTCVPCIGRQILNHRTTRKVPKPLHFNTKRPLFSKRHTLFTQLRKPISDLHVQHTLSHLHASTRASM